MKSEWVGVLFPFYYILIMYLFLTDRFSNPQISTVIDVLLVGSLVIVTLYYTMKVSEQNKLLLRQNKRYFFYDLIWNILDPWTERLSANCDALRNLEFQYLIDKGKIHPGQELVSGLLESQTWYITELESLYGTEVSEIHNYLFLLQDFLTNIANFINGLWTKEVDEHVNENVIRPGIFDKNNTLRWTVRKLLLSEEEFADIHGSRKFDEKVWKPFLRTSLRTFNLEERVKSLRRESMKLSKKSEELCSRLESIENKLAKEYNISLNDLRIRKKQVLYQLSRQR